MDIDEVTSNLGLDQWICEGDGIGGLIKVRAEDFRVVEEGNGPGLDPKGRFTVAKITLNNWETNRFTNRLAKELKISRKRIWFSGTKDKRAVTTQIFVIDAPTNKVAEVDIKDVDVEVIGRTHQKISMGSHQGNRFSVTVRGCANKKGEPLDEESALMEIEKILDALINRLGEGKFPNWIGPQRFGSTRPVTPVVGKFVVNGEWENAVKTYIGMEGFNEMEDVAKFRKEWRDTEDVEASLEIIPKHLGYEKELLYAIKKKPEDWVGAFNKLPNNLQLMTIHSLQSLAFNHILCERIRSGLPISSPIIGDVVGSINTDGKIDTDKLAIVNESTINRISRNCLLGRLAVTGSLIGTTPLQANGEVREIEEKVLKKLGLDEITWIIEDIPRLTTKGTKRPLTGNYTNFNFISKPTMDISEASKKWSEGPREGDRWHPEGACINFQFTLPPGTYATTLLREFTRAPLHQS
ncbi:MAG: tRNA pseudouridine(13) synthase TruD [Thermoplasmata archaeon]|nr:tRNA pseudouridine(13) synthase TruD [Thermoplasmata archaeon]|tara:strand:- start:4764 stop:6161 length:1398 start_codon:yes stop_codon:yes gene_type:complete